MKEGLNYKIVSDGGSEIGVSRPSADTLDPQSMILAGVQLAAHQGQDLKALETAVLAALSGKEIQEAAKLSAKYNILRDDILRMLGEKKSLAEVEQFILQRVVTDLGFSSIFLWDIVDAGPQVKHSVPDDITERYLDNPQILFQLIHSQLLVMSEANFKLDDYSSSQQKLFRKLERKLGEPLALDRAGIRQQLIRYAQSEPAWLRSKLMPRRLRDFAGKLRYLGVNKLANRLGLLDSYAQTEAVAVERAKELIQDPEIILQLLVAEKQSPSGDRGAIAELKTLWLHALQERAIPMAEVEGKILQHCQIAIPKEVEALNSQRLQQLRLKYERVLQRMAVKQLNDRQVGLFKDNVAPSDNIKRIAKDGLPAKLRELDGNSVLGRVNLLGVPIQVMDVDRTQYVQDQVLIALGKLAGVTRYIIVPFRKGLGALSIRGEREVKATDKERANVLEQLRAGGGQILAHHEVTRFMHFVGGDADESLSALRFKYAKDLCELLYQLMEQERQDYSIEQLEKLVAMTLGEPGARAAEHISRRAQAFSKPQLISKFLFFSDIQGFTTFIEKMQKGGKIQEAFDYLTDYFNEMEKIITTYRGHIDKYMGDAIMAAFYMEGSRSSDRIRCQKDAAQAVNAVIEMQQLINTLIENLNNKYGLTGDLRQDLRVRMGLHGDEVMFGLVGSKDRNAPSFIGDGVNMAARLEPINKAYGTWITISASVADLLGEEHMFVPTDNIIVKGKSEPVAIYAVLGYRRDFTSAQVELVEQYLRAFNMQTGGDFERAERFFEQIVQSPVPDPGFGVKPPAQFHRERCRLAAQADRIYREMIFRWHRRDYEGVVRAIDELAGNELPLKKLLQEANEVQVLLSDSQAKIKANREISLSKFRSPSPAIAFFKEGAVWVANWARKGKNVRTIDLFRRAKRYFEGDPTLTWMAEVMIELTEDTEGKVDFDKMNSEDRAIYEYLRGNHIQALELFQSTYNRLISDNSADTYLLARVKESLVLTKNALERNQRQKYYNTLQRLLNEVKSPFVTTINALTRTHYFTASLASDAQASILDYLQREAENFAAGKLDAATALKEWESIIKAFPQEVKPLIAIGNKLKAQLNEQIGLVAQLKKLEQAEQKLSVVTPLPLEALKRVRKDRMRLQLKVNIDLQQGRRTYWDQLWYVNERLLAKFPADPVGLNLREKIVARDLNIYAQPNDERIFQLLNMFFDWRNNIASGDEITAHSRLEAFLATAETYQDNGPFICLLIDLARKGQGLSISHKSVTKAESKSG